MREDSTILLNQIISDLMLLKEDVDKKLYEQNAEGFKKEWDRICEKQTGAFKVIKEENEDLESKMAQILRLMEAVVMLRSPIYKFNPNKEDFNEND